jgi:hypothetical protein
MICALKPLVRVNDRLLRLRPSLGNLLVRFKQWLHLIYRKNKNRFLNETVDLGFAAVTRRNQIAVRETTG